MLLSIHSQKRSRVCVCVCVCVGVCVCVCARARAHMCERETKLEIALHNKLFLAQQIVPCFVYSKNIVFFVPTKERKCPALCFKLNLQGALLSSLPNPLRDSGLKQKKPRNLVEK